MTRSRRTHRLPGALALAVAALAVGYAIIRPIHRRWGATDEEVARPMPGDLEIIGWTRAVSIEASADRIWPWLAQWGQGRGGWYSYDWLENLLGFDIHTADRILPEHQKPRVGDSICLARGVCISKIFVVEPGRFLGRQATMPDGSPAWTFTFFLRRASPRRTHATRIGRARRALSARASRAYRPRFVAQSGRRKSRRH